MDRRLARARIEAIQKELVMVTRQRATQRKERERQAVATAAIVGYTNAGKSSLLSLVSGSEVMARDMLFATLDTTTRKIELPNGQPLLLTDTVGFIRNLPHRLVEAFKSTLEEAVLADFLVQVVDASDPGSRAPLRNHAGSARGTGRGGQTHDRGSEQAGPGAGGGAGRVDGAPGSPFQRKPGVHVRTGRKGDGRPAARLAWKCWKAVSGAPGS